MKWLFVFLVVTTLIPGYSQQAVDQLPVITDVVKAFEQIPEKGTTIYFSNRFLKIPKGGHLQGIQRLRKNQAHLYIISGSSRKLAYYVFAKHSRQKKKISGIKHMAEKPFKHAGGIQLIGDFLVVGIEDNSSKSQSLVNVYNLVKPENTSVDPIITIERSGAPGISTAGAVAIADTDFGHVIAVATWDAETIDLYRSNGKPLTDHRCRFDFWTTWESQKASRTGWINTTYGNYQNINFLKQADGTLFMMGFYKNEAGNFADLFSVTLDMENGPVFTKIGQKEFVCPDGAHFRNGGGVAVNPDGSLSIFAVDRKISGNTAITIFETN